MFELDTKTIRGAMADRQLSLTALANAARISPTTATRLLREGKTRHAPVVGKLADALGVKAQQILK